MMDVAFELLEVVVSNIDFHNICGTGWVIEYLVQQGYVEGNANEICVDIDINSSYLVRISYTFFVSFHTNYE